MAEKITDDLIKQRHKEFNDHVRKVLEEVRGEGKGNVLSRLRQAVAGMRIGRTRRG